MVRFAEVFPDPRVVQVDNEREVRPTQLCSQWPHNSLQRDFYAEMCHIERWNKRTLHQKINGMLYERTALSRKPATLAEMELQ